MTSVEELTPTGIGATHAVCSASAGAGSVQTQRAVAIRANLCPRPEPRQHIGEGQAMKQTSVLVVGFVAAAAGLFLSIAVASAQQAPKYPLDDKLASEPAPWAVP